MQTEYIKSPQKTNNTILDKDSVLYYLRNEHEYWVNKSETYSSETAKWISVGQALAYESIFRYIKDL